MKNKIFTNSMLNILSSPKSLDIVCTAFQPEKQPVEDGKHKQWMQNNTHSHQHKEVLCILDGEGCHGFIGEVYPFSPGTVFLFDSFLEHDNGYPQWTTNVDLIQIVCIPNHLLYTVINIKNGKAERASQTVSFKTNQAFWTTCTNSVSHLPEAAQKIHVYSTTTSLISEILKNSFQETENESESFQRQIVSAMEDRIKHTAGNGINLDTLAQITGYSKFHFERIFKNYTGLSVHQYIDNCREIKTKTMLQEGRRKKEIAQTLGFSSLSTFSRWYKQRLG